MTSISDIPEDVAGEIFSRIPLTSLRRVRSTCKKWDALSKYQAFGKAAAIAMKKHFLGFMVIDFRVYSVRFDLRGTHNHNDFAHPSIKQIDMLNQVKISKVFHSDGLLLCVIKKDNKRLAVWNPYLGQIKWIQPKTTFHRSDMYAFGYDNNRNHKILRFLDVYKADWARGRGLVLLFWFEIFDFSSNSWRVLDVKPHWNIKSYHCSGLSLKGNSYFPAQEKLKDGEVVEDFLVCFDFTTERFRPHLPMPYRAYSGPADSVTLSCVRDEQLAVLYQPDKQDIMEIWITTRIEPNGVSWSKFFKVSMTPLNGFPDDFAVKFEAGSFFVDEEKKIVVVSDAYGYEPSETAYIIGEAGCFKPVTLRKPEEVRYSYRAVMFSSYVPSLVQLQKRND